MNLRGASKAQPAKFGAQVGLFVGCAGWSLRKEHSELFGEGDSHLHRYSSRFNCVEINSSFKSPHKRGTYERWAHIVPKHFRFSVKFPKTISHLKGLRDCEEELEIFLQAVGGLGVKCGPLLLQLPPSASYNAASAEPFFKELRSKTDQRVVIEPRHPTWTEKTALSLIDSFGITIVTADPPPFSNRSTPATSYYTRLHGTPRIYYSSYTEEFLSSLSTRINRDAQRKEQWVIFDNTALGFATPNALDFISLQHDAPSHNDHSPARVK